MQVDPLQVLTRLAAAYNIPSRRVTPPFEGLEEFDYGLRKALDPEFDWQELGRMIIDNTPPNTLVVGEGTFELNFAVFRVPDEEDTVFLIGPWTNGPRSEKSHAWVRKYIGEAGEAAVQEYYNGVHILQPGDFISSIFAVVSVMYGEENIETKEIKEFLPFMFQPDLRYFSEPEFEREIPLAMLEQRYEAENKLLDAVAQGSELTALEAMQQLYRFSCGDRFIGTLYREKTRFIITNTLMRKAIERSQIHPFYIDKISSAYAQRIENLTADPGEEFLQQMVREYCAYVRRYSLRDYSPTVQKVINQVNLNLSEPHTLKSLAAMCFISPSYLSALFKQEVGVTLIDYINTQRIKRGAHLLATTNHTVAAVAEEVGILDVNYFAKMFKKTYSVTPTRYRREQREKK